MHFRAQNKYEVTESGRLVSFLQSISPEMVGTKGQRTLNHFHNRIRGEAVVESATMA